MVNKGITVWLFSTLTFIAVIHVLEAAAALFFSRPIILLKLYPFINELNVTPMGYLFGSATAAIIFWGITCVVALRNPVEAFLGKVLSDAEIESKTDEQVLEEKKNLLALMYEALEMNSTNLSQMKDILFNVRAGVIDISSMKEDICKIELQIGKLTKTIKKFEEKMEKSTKCPACGKPIQPDFKVCPYCGENLRLPQSVIALEKYK